MSILGLENLLQGISKNTFLTEYWSQKPLYCKKGAYDCTHLLQWQDLNSLLSNHRLAYPRIRVMHNGVPVNSEEFVNSKKTITNHASSFLNISSINELLLNGASLIFNAIDEAHEPLNIFCKELSKTFLCNVSANAYIGFGNESGFNSHWDDHEVMVIQLKGKKLWQIYDQGRKYPLREDIESNLTQPKKLLFEQILEEGDFLYIPRGYWHKVTPIGKETLHLSLAAEPPTGYTWLEWVLQKSLVEENTRKNLPLHSNNIEEFAESVKNNFINILKNESIYDFLENRKGRLNWHIKASLPYAVTGMIEDTTPKMRFSGFSYYIENDKIDNELILVGTLDKNWRFNKKTKIIIEKILSAEEFTLDNLLKVNSTISREDIIEMLNELLSAGFIETV